MTAKHSEVNLRKTNPTLYRSILVYALIRVGLAVNFWTTHPTFNPYNIHKDLVGFVFFFLGGWQLVFLHIWRDLRKVRLVLAVSSFVMLSWGLVNTQQFFAGKASLQLPIMFVGVAILQMLSMLEAPVNPMTERK